MQISPLEAIAANVAVAVLTGLTIPVVDSLGFSGHDTQIVAWAGIGVIVLNGILHGYSSSQPGPFAPADPPIVVAASTVANMPPTAPKQAVQVAKAVAINAIQEHQS